MMMEEAAVDDFANRLKLEFEDRVSDASDLDESQDWFVNDHKPDLARSPSPAKSESATPGKEKATTIDAKLNNMSSPKFTSPPKKSTNTAATTDEELDDCVNGEGRTAFLHYIPPTFGILVVELVSGDQIMERRYGSKFFRIYVPQVHESQTDFCLFARKRLNKHKLRFSLDENSMSKWNNPSYGGKVLMTPTPQAKRFKLVVPKNFPRAQFDIEQEARKQELIVRFNSQQKRFNLFRKGSSAEENNVAYRSLIQKFINPVTDIRCPKTNNTVFKIEKEGDAASPKYIVTYARPFSLFISCCIAVGVESHLLE